MEASECIRTRRTIRKYLDKPVPQMIIDKLIESAKYAPSVDNSQSWEFIIITNNKIKRQLSEVNPWMTGIKDAPAAIAILGNLAISKDDFHNAINSSFAANNILIEANNQGLGAAIIPVIDKEFESEEKARSILKIPDDVLVYCIITLGYPDEKPKLKKIREDVVHYDCYLP